MQRAVSNRITEAISYEKLRGNNFVFVVLEQIKKPVSFKQQQQSCLLASAEHPQSTPGTPTYAGIWKPRKELRPQNAGLE